MPLPAKRLGSPSSPPPPPTSSSPSSPTGCWPGCGKSTRSPSGPRWMKSTLPSACAPAGPPGRRRWTSSSRISKSWAGSCEARLPDVNGPRSRRSGDRFCPISRPSGVRQHLGQRLAQQDPRHTEGHTGQDIGPAQQVFAVLEQRHCLQGKGGEGGEAPADAGLPEELSPLP